MENMTEIPKKPKGKDYTDKMQYKREYANWRRKYDPIHREKELKKARERMKWKYNNDPEFREKHLNHVVKTQKERYHNDPEFHKKHDGWVKKYKETHPKIVERIKKTRIEKRKSTYVKKGRTKRFQNDEKYSVYVISNIINGSQYIGITRRNVDYSIVNNFMDKNKIDKKYLNIFMIECIIDNVETILEASRIKSNLMRDKLLEGVVLINKMTCTKKNSTYTVYKLTNRFNDKVYVGATKYTLPHRLRGHKYSAFNKMSNTKVYEFIREISTDETFYADFQIFPLVEYIQSGQDALAQESYWISKMSEDGFDVLNMNKLNTKNPNKFNYINALLKYLKNNS